MSEPVRMSNITCPVCFYRMDTHEALLEKGKHVPQKGDFTLCLSCGAICRYANDEITEIEVVPKQDMVELAKEDIDLFMQIMRLQAAINQVGKTHPVKQKKFN